LRTPLSEEDVRNLKVRDIVDLSGQIIAARDKAHQRLLELVAGGKSAPFELEGLAIYHCGPLGRRIGDRWEILAAGPTTSARMERFESEIIKRFRVRMIIGKGGMGPLTARTLREIGAVYCAIPGGASALTAKSIRKVKAVDWTDHGIAEAIWHLEVKKMGPLIVAMDAHGNSLYNEVTGRAKGILSSLSFGS